MATAGQTSIAASLTIPSAYLLVLMNAPGADPAALLQGSGLTPETLVSSGRIPIAQLAYVLRRYRDWFAQSDWALRVGSQFGINSHGPLGFGALSAATLGAGIDTLVRYAPARASWMSGSVGVGHGECRVDLTVVTDLEDLVVPLIEIVTVVIQSYLNVVRAQPSREAVIELPFADPGYTAAYAEVVNGSVQFDATQWRIRFPARWRAQASPFSDPDMYVAAVAKCEQELELIGRTAHRVRGLLARAFLQRINGARHPLAPIPTAEQLATELHVAPRTLIRHLKREGTSYQALRDDLLAGFLRTLLAQHRMPLADVSSRLGFDDPANFTRACRRLLQQTPTALRSASIHDRRAR